MMPLRIAGLVQANISAGHFITIQSGGEARGTSAPQQISLWPYSSLDTHGS